MSVLCKTEEIIVDTNDYNSDEADDNIRLTLEDSGGENYHSSYHTTQINSSSSPRQQQHEQHIPLIPQHHHTVVGANTGKSSLKNIMENEKRMRREIANSNERRRMQSINAGFQSLRSLLPHHEGEKLSKAAILQQTAQYIIELEREKTHLLSQNSQLKRLLGQHEVGCGGGVGGGGGGGGVNENTNAAPGTIKKRKLTDAVMNIQTISDSSDEGLGSMSPEPVTLIGNGQKNNTSNYINCSAKEISDLKTRLDAERKRRLVLEERLRQAERQVYPNQFIKREVIEHTGNIREEELSVSVIPADPLKLQVVEIDSLPSVGQTQVVVCSSIEEMQEEEAETITDEMIHTDLREEVIIRDEPAEYVEVPSRLQPILEAAIKAEPKVEVERINATLTKIKQEPNTTQEKHTNGRMYLTSTSRQNLETIVEAIRHLEGDHLFGDMVEQKKAQRAQQQQQPQPQPQQQKQQQQIQSQSQKQKHPAQDAPLALTNKSQQRKQLPAELSPFLQLKKTSNSTVTVVGTSGVSIQTVSNSNSTNSSNNISSSSNLVGTTNNSNNTNNSITGISTLKSHQSTPLSNTTAMPPSSTATVTIAAALKQCRPGVIVAKQIS